MLYNQKILIIGGGKLKKICLKKYDYIVLVNRTNFDTENIPVINVINSNEEKLVNSNNIKLIVNNSDLVTPKIITKNIVKKKNKKNKNMRYITNKEVQIIKKKLNIKNSLLPPFFKVPSTGIIAIMYFYEKQNNIDIMGFDRLVSENNNKDYYVNYISNGIFDNLAHLFHDFDSENIFIRNLLKNKKITNICLEKEKKINSKTFFLISLVKFLVVYLLYLYFYKIKVLNLIFNMHLITFITSFILLLFTDPGSLFLRLKNIINITSFPLNFLIYDKNFNKYVTSIFIIQNLYLFFKNKISSIIIFKKYIIKKNPTNVHFINWITRFNWWKYKKMPIQKI
jgi:hypothetical protein